MMKFDILVKGATRTFHRLFVMGFAMLMAAWLLFLGLAPAATIALSAPVVEDQAFSVLESSATGTFVGMVLAADTLTYTIIDGNSAGAFSLNATSGELTVADGTQLDYETSPSFALTVEVENSSEQTDTGLVTVNVININDAPVIADQAFNIAEHSANGTTVGVVVATDSDGDRVRYAIVAGNTGATFALAPTSGTLTVADNTLLDFETRPEFDLLVHVTDGGLGDIAIVSISLVDANDLPVAVNDNGYVTTENNQLVGATPSVLDNDSDPDASDTLTAVLDTSPANGTVSLSPDGTFTYTPALDFDGSDSFTYFANDGTANSALPATVTVTVTGDNDPPTAADDPGYSTPEDTTLEISGPGVLGNDTDPEHDPLTAVVAGDPASGDLELRSDGSFVYTPSLNFVGTDTFTYRAKDDGAALSNIATVTIAVNGVNVPPSLEDGVFAIDENSSTGTTVGTVTASDPDTGDSLIFAIIGGNTDSTFLIDSDTGEIKVNNNNTLLDFETNPQFILTVNVTDTGDLTDTAQVTINLNNVNESEPDINEQAFSIAENSANGSLVGTVVVTDSDGIDTSAFAITAGDPDGVFGIDHDGKITVANNNTLDFETTPAYILTVVVTDSGGLTDSAPMNITVNNANDAPIIENSDLAVAPGTIQETEMITVTGVFTDQDAADAHTITIDWDDGSPATTIILAAGDYDFTANHTYNDDPAGISDDYLIQVTVEDATVSDSASISATVTNIEPTLGELAAEPTTLAEGQVISVTGSITEASPADSFVVKVEWGDGVENNYSYPAGSTTFMETHIYLDDFQPANIKVTLTDDDGGSDSGTTTATIDNVPPTADAGPAIIVADGDSIRFKGTVSDPGAWDSHTYLWDFGDGVSLGNTLEPIYIYGSIGVYTVTLSVTDDDGGMGSDETTVTVISPSDLVGTKQVSGDFTEGGTVIYTIVLENEGTSHQFDNPGAEFEDVLPDELRLMAARVVSGGGSATAATSTNTVTWSGQILAGSQVVIKIEAEVLPGFDGQEVSNQGQINYDANGNGSNEAVTFTDDPSQPGSFDPTVFSIRETFTVYLPIILNNFAAAPDLIVTEISAQSDLIEVTIKNQGSRATSGGFWVDLYIDPTTAPTEANQLWTALSNEGLAWGITVPLAAQESMTLTFSTEPGAENEFYVAEESMYSGSMTAGTPIYVQVDSAHVNVPYGGILETHEITGGTYNNIASSTATAGNP